MLSLLAGVKKSKHEMVRYLFEISAKRLWKNLNIWKQRERTL